MKKITSLKAREILDSRGNPTIEVTCILESGAQATASVPSGASTGIHEAMELRDNDKKRYNGLGVLKVLKNIEEVITPKLLGQTFTQQELDAFLISLDGTKNKSYLGANAILAVSISFAYACAQEENIPLYVYLSNTFQNKTYSIPQPMFNIINGGKHADSGLDIQEFMIVPLKFDSIKEKIRVGSEIFHTLRNIIKNLGYSTGVGDEGGFAPKVKNNEDALDLIVEAITQSGYSVDEVKISLDVAASTFYKNGAYTLNIYGKEQTISSEELLRWYEELKEKYPIYSIEDGFAEDDWNGFKKMKQLFDKNIYIIGDDLTVTNVERIQTAIDNNAINAVLIKPNQIGTVSETVDAILYTKKQGWVPFISHRSGETECTFIADLAVGLSCPFIKSGSLSRGERISKYNRLMEIEDSLTNTI